MSWSETPSRSLCTGFIHHHSPIITDLDRQLIASNTAVRLNLLSSLSLVIADAVFAFGRVTDDSL